MKLLPACSTALAFLAPVALPQAKTPDYSSEPLVLEQSASTFHYHADGTGDELIRQVLHLQSDAAVRQFGLVSIPYPADSVSVEVHYVRVRKPNGAVIATDTAGASVQDMPAPVTQQAPLYSDQRQLQIPVRSLSVGDRLEYEAVLHIHKAEAPGQFWNALNFEDKAVTLDQSVELRIPATLKLTVVSPLHKPETRTEAGETVYRWHSAQTQPSVPAPGAKPEDPRPRLVPDIAWTTFPSWAAVGEWYRALSVDRIAPTPELRAKAAALSAGATDDNDRIARIFKFVSMDIRYIGVDFGVGRFQPHSAAEVLSNGYGDCKDKHTLLAALLGIQGIHADPALIGANVAIDKDLPAPNSFNHVVTAIARKGQPLLWLDSTEEVAPPGMLIGFLRDKDALLIPTGSAPSLVKTPANPPFPSFNQWQATGTLSSAGKLSAHFSVTMRGDWELLARFGLFSGSRDQWNQVGQNISNTFGFGGTVSDFAATGVDASAQPLHFTYAYARDSYGDWDNHRTLSMLPPGLFAQPELEKQPTDPIELGAPRSDTAQSTLTLPEGFSPSSLPTNYHAASSFAIFDIAYTLHGRDLVTDATLHVLKEKVPPADWKEYNTFAKDVNGNSGLFIALERGRPSLSGGTKPQQTQALPAPPPPSSVFQTNTRAQLLEEQGFEAARADDWARARASYEAARAAAPDQIGLGVLAAALYAEDHHFSQAEAELTREETLHPENKDRILRMRLNIELMQKHTGDAIATIEDLRKLNGDDPAITRREAALLTGDKRYEDAMVLLEAAAFKNPSDKQTMLALGSAQMAAGRTREAVASLKNALADSDDPEILNGAAYALADHNLELPLAHDDAQKALTVLAAKTKTASIDPVTGPDLAAQRLLPAIWDTLGWISYLQGDTAAAEPLLNAAWLGTERPEVGYHLGMLYEKQGKAAKALELYTLANAAKLPSRHFAEEEALGEHTAKLEKTGLQAHFPQSAPGMLARERSLTLPLLVDKSAHADFFVLASSGAVKQMAFIEGDASLRGQTKAIESGLERDHSALLASPGAPATLLRRGTLSCSHETHSCEFTLFLPADTRLPQAPKDAIASTTPGPQNP